MLPLQVITLLSLQKLSNPALFCISVVQQAYKNCLPKAQMLFMCQKLITIIQISNKFEIYIKLTHLLLQATRRMNKIKAYIRKLTQPRTKSAYQKSITYLLNIVEALMVSPKDQTPNKLSKRSLSEEKSEKINSIQVNHPKVDDREYSEDINSQSFKGSEISLVQKYKQKAHSPIMQRLDKKQDKINLRQFQQSIEIYYQCLYKSIQLIELLQQKVSKISNQSTNSLTKLRQFRQNYEIQRQNCQDFKSLINMSRQFVSKQFLTAIHQIRQPLLKGRYEKKQNRYLVVYE